MIPIATSLTTSPTDRSRRSVMHQLRGRMGLAEVKRTSDLRARFLWAARQWPDMLPLLSAALWYGTGFTIQKFDPVHIQEILGDKTPDGWRRMNVFVPEAGVRLPVMETALPWIAREAARGLGWRSFDWWAVATKQLDSGRDPNERIADRAIFIDAVEEIIARGGGFAEGLTDLDDQFQVGRDELGRYDALISIHSPSGETLPTIFDANFRSTRTSQLARPVMGTINLIHVDDRESSDEIDVAKAIGTTLELIFDWAVATGTDLWPLRWDEAVAAQRNWHDKLSGGKGYRETVPEAVVLARWPDGAHIDRLTTKEHLSWEGSSMGHCVGGNIDPDTGMAPGDGHHYQMMRDGESIYLSYRGTDDVPVATIQLSVPGTAWDVEEGESRELAEESRTRLVQAMGPDNELVRDNTAASRMKTFLQRAGVSGVDHSHDLSAVNDPMMKLLQLAREYSMGNKPLGILTATNFFEDAKRMRMYTDDLRDYDRTYDQEALIDTVSEIDFSDSDDPAQEAYDYISERITDYETDITEQWQSYVDKIADITRRLSAVGRPKHKQDVITVDQNAEFSFNLPASLYATDEFPHGGLYQFTATTSTKYGRKRKQDELQVPHIQWVLELVERVPQDIPEHLDTANVQKRIDAGYPPKFTRTELGRARITGDSHSWIPTPPWSLMLQHTGIGALAQQALEHFEAAGAGMEIELPVEEWLEPVPVK